MSELLEFSVQNFLCSERRRCFMSIAELNNQLNNIFFAKLPNWRGFCGGNHWTLFLQPTWKYEHRMVYLSKLSIKTSMFRALYFRWRQWNGMFPIETTFVAHDNNEVLTVKLRHETSLVAYSTDKCSSEVVLRKWSWFSEWRFRWRCRRSCLSSLVSGHPCMRKWSLMGGGRLPEKSTK